MLELLEVLGQATAIRIFYMGLAIIVAFVILHHLDVRLAKGRSAFAQHFRAMQGSPVALAIYLGLRFHGVCSLAAAFLRP